jgi:hypothetical protein
VENPRFAFAAVYESEIRNADDVHGGTHAAPLIGKVLREVFANEAKVDRAEKTDAKKKKKGKAEEKKPNAMVQRALELQAAKRAEEERIAAAIQAAKEAEEAEIRRIEEEERVAKEEKDRKKAAKKAARDQATKEGKAVSAKDKEREARNAQYDFFFDIPVC